MTAMPAPIQRSPITADILTLLATLGKPVGDGQIPAGANWIGQPNAPGSSFDPYLVLSEITAGHSWGAFADEQGNWQMPYLVESFGISRRACSWMADQAREALTGLRRHTFSIDGTMYGVQKVRIDSIGAPVRVGAFQPPVWHTQDGATLWVGKGA